MFSSFSSFTLPVGILRASAVLAMTWMLSGSDCNGPSVAGDFPDGPRWDLTGTWSFEVDVTKAPGTCSSEENEPPWTAQVEIVQTDPDPSDPDNPENVVATGPWNSDPGTGDHVLRGTTQFDQLSPGGVDRVVIEGSWPEDGGTTEARFQLTTNDGVGGLEMSGTESWDWSESDGDSCNDGRSEVAASKNPNP